MIEPLAFRDVGNGPTLLLIHGSFSNGTASWANQLRSLSDSIRLIVPDRRGYGSSPKAPRSYTIESDAHDVLTLLQQRALGSVHLAGHSSGGLVAIEVACQVPGAICSLHLIEPPYMSLLSPETMSTPMAQRAGQVFADAKMLGPEATAVAFFTYLVGESGVERLRQSKGWAGIVAEAGRVAYEKNPGDYPARRLTELCLSVPVIVYVGGKSDPAHNAIAQIIVERVAGSRLVVAPEAGHAVQLTSDLFDREVLALVSAKA